MSSLTSSKKFSGGDTLLLPPLRSALHALRAFCGKAEQTQACRRCLMFQILTNMTKAEWDAQGLTPDERGIPYATPILDLSDDSGEGNEDASSLPRKQRVGSCAQKWRASETERDRARQCGLWPDGARVGRGFGQPYLKPAYAEAITQGLKTVEGRPNEGVCRQLEPDVECPLPDFLCISCACSC